MGGFSGFPTMSVSKFMRIHLIVSDVLISKANASFFEKYELYSDMPIFIFENPIKASFIDFL